MNKYINIVSATAFLTLVGAVSLATEVVKQEVDASRAPAVFETKCDSECRLSRIESTVMRVESALNQLRLNQDWQTQVLDVQRKDRETVVKADSCFDKCGEQFGQFGDENEPENITTARRACFKRCSDKYHVPGGC